jgi:hypothetical protein
MIDQINVSPPKEIDDEISEVFSGLGLSELSSKRKAVL